MSRDRSIPRLRAVSVIARREYRTRIRSKGFWISTVTLPILMSAWVVLPSLIAARSEARQRLVIADAGGEIAEPLATRLRQEPAANEAQVRFEVEVLDPVPSREKVAAALDRRVLEAEIDAWIWIAEDFLETDRVDYSAESVSNLLTQDRIEDTLAEVATRRRLESAGYDSEAISEMIRPVALTTLRVTEEGTREEAGLGGFALALGVFMILYIATLIYGQQVMMGVLDEKSSRILEIVVSTVRPFELLVGKLGGICLVGLTQLAIWAAAAVVLTGPALLAALPLAGGGPTLPQVPLSLVAHLLLFFLLGFVLYASFYAAIGSAFNNPQEAQHLASIPVIFVVLPWLFFFPVSNDPDSTLAVVTSLIPVLTPFLLPLRLAVKAPPGWQVALGYAVTAGAALLSLWFSARIYRVGILMYGKKPTIFEIWRWMRYR